MHERHTHSSRHKHRLWAVLALSTVFMVIQVVVGWWTGSLALLADAAHLFVDAAGVGLSLLAVERRRNDRGGNGVAQVAMAFDLLQLPEVAQVEHAVDVVDLPLLELEPLDEASP